MVETIILCIVFGAFIMLAFVFGVKIGQSTKMGEKVEIKTPIQAIKEQRIERKTEEELSEQNRLTESILQNIDSYDGTGFGQIEL